MSGGGECEGYVGVGWRIWEINVLIMWLVVAVAYALYMRWVLE